MTIFVEGVGNMELCKETALSGTQQTVLDLFRIIAALFVMLGHSFSFYQCTVFKDQTYFPYLQNIGVVLFFLLSGFLTAYSLNKNNYNHKYTFEIFFKHKMSRILKEYIPGLVLIALIDGVSIAVNGERYAYYQAYNIKHFVGNVLMLHNMGPNSILGHFFIPFGSGRPLWTLPVEWWLYMLYAALFLSISNKLVISVPRVMLFGMIVFMSCNYLITGRGAGLGFVFLLGVIAFYVNSLLKYETAMLVFVCSCMLYMIYGAIYKEAYTVCSFIILWLIFVSTLKIGEGSTERKSRRNPILCYLSKSTFMLYLTHYSVIDLFVRLNSSSFSIVTRFSLGIIVSVFL